MAHVITTRMEARYRSAKTLEATFLERYSENARLLRSESGTAYFRRPGKMRWEYEAPEKELFLVDGKTAWFYVPADHTVTRVPAKQSTDFRTPMALLAGEMKVSRVCARVELVPIRKPPSTREAQTRCFSRWSRSQVSWREYWSVRVAGCKSNFALPIGGTTRLYPPLCFGSRFPLVWPL
jgi:hypothetical protein